MKYAVTGSTGFIGSYVTRKLLEAGHQVNVITRVGRTEETLKTFETHRNLKSFEYDKTSDSLIPAVEDADFIIHLAALFTTKRDSESVKSLMKSNIDFSVDLFQAVQDFNPTAGITSASTFSAFNEKGEYAPQTFYAATKHAVEVLAEGFGIKAVFLRFSDTYGLNDPRTKIVSLVRDAVLNEKDFAFQSLGEQKINLTHVDDVYRALVEASSRAADFHTKEKVEKYDLFYPENEVTLKEMSELLNHANKASLTFATVGTITELPPQKDILPGFEIRMKPEALKELTMKEEVNND